MAVVAHHRDAKRLAAGERHHRVERAQATAQQVERELGPRDVGDDEVEVALAGLQARRLAEDRRRGEAGEVGEHLGADRLAGALEVVHRHADLLVARRGVLDPDRQRRPHRGDAIAQRAALDVGAHRDGHHRLQHQPLGGMIVRAQPAAECEADGGQHHVVEGAPERVLDRLEAGEVGVDPGVAAVGADVHVQG